MLNALTIDVEDYYMVSAFADTVKFEDWPGYESRVEMNTYRILDLLDRYSVRATFFILGWIAEQKPNVIKEIHKRGHELASHGYNHRLVYDLSPKEFCEDTRRAKRSIEDIIGEAVIGYRATSFSIMKETTWALDILMEEGFLYDSSIFPVRHDRYGMPGAERFSHIIERNGGRLTEFPPSTYSIFGNNIPVGGGGYLRIFPLWFTKIALSNINNKEKKPVVFYIHPWEVDPNQPRLKGSAFSMFRHYTNLHSTVKKLGNLLESFMFGPVRDIL